MGKEQLERLAKKLEQKKKEELKTPPISPEEQRLIDQERRYYEEQAREFELRRNEENKFHEFKARCNQELRPLFERIQALVFRGRESKIVVESKYPSYGLAFAGFPKRYYKISLQWDFHWQADRGDGRYGGETYQSISVEVTSDAKDPTRKDEVSGSSFPKSEFTIQNLSKIGIARSGLFSGLFSARKDEWVTKVSLNDADWEGKVEDYILEQLKQKRVI
jgi:hypothetical protein